MIRWGDEMLTENIATQIRTQIKLPNIKTHKTFEDLIGLKRREDDGWQNSKGKHSARMKGYEKDKYKSRWQIQKVLIGWGGVDSWQKLGKSTLVAGKMLEGKSVSVLLVKSQTGGESERARWGNAKYIQLQI